VTTASGVGSTRARAIAVLAALVLASGIAGAAVDRTLVRRARMGTLYDTTFHPLSSILRSPTAADRQQYREQLQRALDLTASQDSAIDRVMSERAGEFTALREEIRPRVDRLVTDVRAGIERVLTDRQREEFRRIQARGREQLVSNGQAP
jgi:DNA anti-recombination protein RmuC